MIRPARTALALCAGIPFVLVPLACVTILQAATAPEQDGPSKLARQILEATGVNGGVIVQLGCGDGRLTGALGKSDHFLVQGLDADAANVEAARKYIRSLGLYGKVSVEPCAGNRLPYVDNLVNLIVSEDLGEVPMDEVMRVLAPLGVAYIKTGGNWTKTVKPWPKDVDEWTHYLHGPDNNAVAKDRVVGPPEGVQWVEGPLWQRHHEMNANPDAMVSAKGRLFYIKDEAPATVSGLPDQWLLEARDAFNGVLLWKRPVPGWGWKAWSAVETGGRFNVPLHIPRRLVAVGDRVFVTLGFNAPLSALDAATGKIVKTYDGTQWTDEILFHDGLLILSVNNAPQEPDSADAQQRMRAKRRQAPQEAASPETAPVRKRVMVLNAETGQILWTKDAFTGVFSSPISSHILHITRLLTAVGDGKIVCVEKDALVALDLKTGRELWRTPRPTLPPNPSSLRENLLNFSTLVMHQDVVVFLQTEESYEHPADTGKRGVHCRLIGLSADTGKVLWTQPCSKWGPASEGDVFVIGDLVWTHHPTDFAVIGIDLHSGQIKRTISTTEAFDEVHHHRCFRNKATERYLLTARRGIETIDLDQGRIGKNEWVRGACRYGIMPCNGLIYVPPHPCQCYIDVKVNGFFAMASDRGGSRSATGRGQGAGDEAVPLERGPAFGQTLPPSASRAASSADWPTYRHDIRRSGSTTAAVPDRLKRLWQTPLGTGTSASACTIAGGRVFAAAVDEHRVVALDVTDGHVLWDYTVGGRVDTPPTVDGGRVLFGSADGWVYCVRAADGVLVWRFRAAPDERRIVAFGQLESLWPVHGTVLVSGGVAYVAAGRSTHLDGGIRVCALEPETGELIRELRPANGEFQGLEDVLVGVGDRVFMRHLEFCLNADRSDTPGQGSGKPPAFGPRAYSTAGLLDDSCFARVGWSTKSDIGKNRKSKGGRLGKLADLLVFDPEATYRFGSRRQGGFGGWFQAGTGAYELAAVDNRTGKPRWTVKIPIRVRALASAGQVLLAAGPADVVDPQDPWASIEGRAGSLLWVIDAAGGAKLAEYTLDEAPRWDGLAVAGGKVFLSSLDGKVICFGKDQ